MKIQNQLKAKSKDAESMQLRRNSLFEIFSHLLVIYMLKANMEVELFFT